MMFTEQSILDLSRRHSDERLGMRLPGHAIRGSVQYSGQRAIGCEYWCRDAGEIVVARKKVLAPMHNDRSFEMRRSAKAVGTANMFRPNSAGPDACRVGSVAEARVGYYVEQQAIRVRKGNHEIGAGDLLMQRVHLSEREASNQRTTLLFLTEYCRADKFGRRRVQRVEAERNAAHPAIVDIGRQKFRWRRSALLERHPRIFDGPASRQHHRLLPEQPFGNFFVIMARFRSSWRASALSIIDQTLKIPNSSSFHFAFEVFRLGTIAVSSLVRCGSGRMHRNTENVKKINLLRAWHAPCCVLG